MQHSLSPCPWPMMRHHAQPMPSPPPPSPTTQPIRLPLACCSLPATSSRRAAAIQPGACLGFVLITDLSSRRAFLMSLISASAGGRGQRGKGRRGGGRGAVAGEAGAEAEGRHEWERCANREGLSVTGATRGQQVSPPDRLPTPPPHSGPTAPSARPPTHLT